MRAVPRFAIVDAYTNSSYVLTDDTLGTSPWRLQQARFQTGPNTNLLLLKIVRQPAGPLIRGKLWIDDLKLVETNNSRIGTLKISSYVIVDTTRIHAESGSRGERAPRILRVGACSRLVRPIGLWGLGIRCGR